MEPITINSKTVARPFLRWAGGKKWLVKDLHNYLPKEGFNNYIEPFLGGGAVFFYLSPEHAILSDLNAELIEAYTVLRDSVDDLIEELSKFRNTKEFYYRVRSQSFKNEIKRAAKFIYLNQTSFNGIYRVNLEGKYNVPFGYRQNEFLQQKKLIQASASLQNVRILSRDFSKSLNDIQKGDLVFVDPPYTVTHNNNGFIKYNAKLFDIHSQNALGNYLDSVNEIGAYYILTNAAHKDVRAIFERKYNEIYTVSRASLVGGLNAKRGRYEEFVITNIDQNGRQH